MVERQAPACIFFKMEQIEHLGQTTMIAPLSFFNARFVVFQVFPGLKRDPIYALELRPRGITFPVSPGNLGQFEESQIF